MDKFASLDTSNAESSKARESVGPTRWDDFTGRDNCAIQSFNESVVMYRPVCRTTLLRRVCPWRRCYRWDFYYLIPGKEKEAEAVAKDYVKLFEQKHINDSYNLYQGLMGTDLPVYIVAYAARNQPDLVAADQGVNNTLGTEGRTLQARAMAATRRFDRREGIARPDLAYPALSSAAK